MHLFKNWKLCRYVTYEIKETRNYVHSYMKTFIYFNDKLFICELSDDELKVLDSENRVLVQSDNIINSIESEKYFSYVYIGVARVPNDMEKKELLELFLQKYNRVMQGNIICLESMESINVT